jgi:hypothetical protein
METSRIQIESGEAVLEVTRTTTSKRHVREEHLQSKKAYFESLIAKGQAGLAEIEAQLTTLKDAQR